jgi:hypothetical protein
MSDLTAKVKRRRKSELIGIPQVAILESREVDGGDIQREERRERRTASKQTIY